MPRAAFEEQITESDRPAPPGTTQFDSQLGFAIRRWCAPVLGLPPSVPAEEYLARRAELGPDQATGLLLRAAGVACFLIDTGYVLDTMLSLPEMAAAAGAQARRDRPPGAGGRAGHRGRGRDRGRVRRALPRRAGRPDQPGAGREEHHGLPARAGLRPGSARARGGGRGRGPLAARDRGGRRRPGHRPGAAAPRAVGRGRPRPAGAVPYRVRGSRLRPAPERPAVAARLPGAVRAPRRCR